MCVLNNVIFLKHINNNPFLADMGGWVLLVCVQQLTKEIKSPPDVLVQVVVFLTASEV